MPLLATALVGGLLVLAAYAGPTAVGLVGLGVVGLISYGITGGRPLADRLLPGTLVLATGASAAGAVWFTGSVGGAETGLGPMVAVLGPAVVLALFTGLTSLRARFSLESLCLACTGAVFAALAAALPALARTPHATVWVAIVAGAGLVGAAAGGPAIAGRPRWSWFAAAAVLVTATAALVLVETASVDLASRTAVAVGSSAAALVGAAAARALTSAVPSGGRVPQAALVASVAYAAAAPSATVLVRIVLA